MNDTGARTIISEQALKLGHGAKLGENAVLVILSARDFGRARVVDRPRMTVGRQRGCGFRIRDPLVSGEHCRILFNAEEGFFIEDRESSNGTFVNAQKVTRPTRLQYGDRIVVGSTVLRFYLEETIEAR
jgi:pSer/pThr/pTyr-binding forkhead associated (FHA) protein